MEHENEGCSDTINLSLEDDGARTWNIAVNLGLQSNEEEEENLDKESCTDPTIPLDEFKDTTMANEYTDHNG
ncbi:hypothetical protein PIB30_023401 [Stylosanthes scabra]|uniref:Uncharacterized protein n=1 Tax=Stylosanthes scabra TaxID=79078 RepID=A0ABU6WD05_9FABA|nr:hypothetical protein [Stylosanthes scabra]